MECQLITILILCSLLQLHRSLGKKAEVYTPAETNALKELYHEVKNDLYLDYQHHNRYLINWLRNKNLDVLTAATALRSSLKYRQENKIDNVLMEDEMLRMHKLYPATFGKAVDREGNPAYQVAFSTWDIRKAMILGQRTTLARYIFFIFESSMRAARELEATNFIFFADMSNYSFRKHSCLACIPYYVDLTTTYERHFPNTARYVIAINTPRLFETASNVMLPLMSAETQKVYKIFGPDKEEWQKFVHEVFSPEQLTKQYGGTKPF